MMVVFVVFSALILFNINRLTSILCTQKEIPEEKHPKIFRTINIYITILLISSYVEILYT
ncbi:hypothetical protein WDJ61_04735 [Bacillus sp. FJAT-52991]|uniref:Uncharacterized protein n=1 Tax=Bacillus kandeliae TaxID=3129297 RepID=A0ABZ2NC52_9BACI